MVHRIMVYKVMVYRIMVYRIMVYRMHKAPASEIRDKLSLQLTASEIRGIRCL